MRAGARPARSAAQAALLSAVLAFTPAARRAAAQDAVHGAGATFPAPLYARWGEAYRRETGVAVRFDATGSGSGVDAIRAGRVDFGASDAPLPPDALVRFGLVQFPVVIGAVVPVVNLRGIAPGALRLSGDVLAAIFLGRVTKWDAAPIAALNPALALPDANITVVHRGDASGTTFLFSDYLSRVDADWRARVGTGLRLDWPLGEAATGNEGVASTVQRTRASIGYVESAYAVAHRLAGVALRNADGAFVAPQRDGFAAAAASARWQTEADLAQSLIGRNGAASWPIVGVSFALVRKPADAADGADAAPSTLRALKFFDWAWRRGDAAAWELGYVPLPPAAAPLIESAWTARLHDAAGASMWP